MIYLQITTNKSNGVIFSNLTQTHINLFINKKNSKGEKYLRSYYKKEKEYNIWLISEDEDLYKSNKLFNKTYNTYLQIIDGLYQHYSIGLMSSMHTIATIQAKMSQKIEPFVIDAKKGSQEQRIHKVEEILDNKNNTDIVDLICFLSKRIEELNIHLESLKIIDDNVNKTNIKLSPYNLKNILLNVYDPFKESFGYKRIQVNFERVEDVTVRLDYTIFNLIFHHIFDNAVKYSKEKDKIEFIFSTQNQLIIKMHSLTIEDTKEIFLKGVSGKNAGELAGDGIGMFVIKKGLQVMGMDINLQDEGKLNNHSRYSKNKFVIDFNIKIV